MSRVVLYGRPLSPKIQSCPEWHRQNANGLVMNNYEMLQIIKK